MVAASGPEPSQTAYTLWRRELPAGAARGVPDTGVAYVFTGGAGGWHLVAELFERGEAEGDDLGDSVAMSGRHGPGRARAAPTPTCSRLVQDLDLQS